MVPSTQKKHCFSVAMEHCRNSNFLDFGRLSLLLGTLTRGGTYLYYLHHQKIGGNCSFFVWSTIPSRKKSFKKGDFTNLYPFRSVLIGGISYSRKFKQPLLRFVGRKICSINRSVYGQIFVVL